MGQNGSISAAVIAPTFNNAGTLREAVSQVAALKLPVIVVDDGCTDGTPQLLKELERELGITVVTHGSNQGKAAALQSGFAAAHARGYTHAVTIDTDGQLDPSDIPRLLEEAREIPRALILGTRDAGAADYPGRSWLGRRAANHLVLMETGFWVDDTQCGLRVYPLGLVRTVHCRAGRFGYETEIITQAAWAGWDIRGVSVSCRYILPGGRVSHFRPWIDSFRAVAIHFRLLVLTILPRRSVRPRTDEYAETTPAVAQLAHNRT